MKQEESNLQRCCVSWFRLQYPKLSTLLFAVPNGGSRNAIEAARMKGEGVTAGVADLLLLVPGNGFHGLAIEMKAGKNKQTEKQIAWQQAVEAQGYRYVVCRSFDEFRQAIQTHFAK
jgi:hypothetical protein